MITIVSGIPRSGTSMMMQMLEAGGVPVFHTPHADAFNPNGYYETPETMLGGLEKVPDGHAVKCLHKLAIQSHSLDTRVIVMRRDMDDILDSLVRNNRARREQTGQSIELLSPAFLQDSLDSVRRWCAGVMHIEVWYEDALFDPEQECQRVALLLGRPLNIEAMIRVISRKSS